MLNKKAIAAFAAGATLLSGMAFAAPAFAAETPKKPTAEQCKSAQDDVNAKNAALQDAKDDLVTANAAKRRAHSKLDAAKAAVAAYKTAVKNFTEAKSAIDDVDASDGVAVAQAKKKADDAAKAVKDAIDAAEKTDVKLEGAKPNAPADNAGAAPDKKAYDAKLKDIKTDDVDKKASDAQDAVSAAQDKLDLAKIHLTNLGCQASGSEQNPPKHDPTTPTQPGSVKDADAAKADVMVKAAAYDAARVKNAAAKADAQKAYEEAAKAKKADEAAQAEVEAAQKAVDLFAGDKTSKEYKDLNDRLDRAKAKKTFTENTFKAAAAKYAEKQAAFDAANAEAQKAYDAYKAAVNVAAAFGVDVTKLPVVVAMDPLDKTFPGFADAQQLYRDAQSGKFGPAAAAAAKGAANGAAAADKKADKQGKITVEKGKDKAGKNLPKTGAAIALTALAASVLAGMGAAVRKVRH